jgi:hypothetical protein
MIKVVFFVVLDPFMVEGKELKLIGQACSNEDLSTIGNIQHTSNYYFLRLATL